MRQNVPECLVRGHSKNEQSEQEKRDSRRRSRPLMTRHSRPASIATGSSKASCGLRIINPRITPEVKGADAISETPRMKIPQIRNPDCPIMKLTFVGAIARAKRSGATREAASA